MSHRGRTLGRGHLRLAIEPVPSAFRPQGKPLLLLRALAVAFALALANLVAIAAMAMTLVPLVWRRAPLGRRLRPIRREARVIPWPAERRAAPR